MRKYLLLLAAAAFVAAPRAAHAGYTATLAPSLALTPDSNGNNVADVGESFTVTGASFGSFAPDGPSDPQITAGDLGRYLFTLNGAASSVSGNLVNYSGGYTIFYDLNDNGSNDDGYNVSVGNFSINATFGGGGAASLNGTLSQTSSYGSPFGDLGQYGPASFLGTYIPTVIGQGNANQGMLSGTLRAPADAAAIPEPGSMALLAMGGLPFLGMIRRRRKA